MIEETTGQFIDSVSSIVSDLPEAVTSASKFSEFIDKLKDIVAQYAASIGLRVIAALLILIIGFKLIKHLSKRIQNAKDISKINPTAKSFIRSFLNIALKIVVVVTAAAVLGVPMTSVAALIASAGLAIGLALEGSLGNIASGFIIVITKPFSVGDYIIVGDNSGTVQDTGIFYTTLTSLDNRTIVMPNSTVTNQTLVNLSAKQHLRVDLEFSAGYENDPDLVEKLMLKTAAGNDKILKDPPPFARLSKHGDSALVYTLRVWCRSGDYWTVHFDMLKDIEKAFTAAGISIPYPQLDVHVCPNGAASDSDINDGGQKSAIRRNTRVSSRLFTPATTTRAGYRLRGPRPSRTSS